MTSGNVSDEPIAFRQRRRGRAARRHRRPLPAARSRDRIAVRRFGGRDDRRHAVVLRRVARLRAAAGAAVARLRAAGPRLRRAAEEHVLHRRRATARGSVRTSATSTTCETYDSLRRRRSRAWSASCRVRPEVVAHDLHPDYLSTRYAQQRPDAIHVAVQHHHAHVVSAMAEHGIDGPAIGIGYDGTGYGTDGTIVGRRDPGRDAASFRARRDVPPAAARRRRPAIREPWRIALALVVDAFGGERARSSFSALFDAVADARARGRRARCCARGCRLPLRARRRPLLRRVRRAVSRAGRKASFEGQSRSSGTRSPTRVSTRDATRLTSTTTATMLRNRSAAGMCGEPSADPSRGERTSPRLPRRSTTRIAAATAALVRTRRRRDAARCRSSRRAAVFRTRGWRKAFGRRSRRSTSALARERAAGRRRHRARTGSDRGCARRAWQKSRSQKSRDLTMCLGSSGTGGRSRRAHRAGRLLGRAAARAARSRRRAGRDRRLRAQPRRLCHPAHSAGGCRRRRSRCTSSC